MGMGSVEKDAGKIAKRARVQDAVLLTLYGVSGAALLALAPNALRLLKYIDPDFTGKRNPAYRIKEAAARLESRGLLTKSKRGGTISGGAH